MADCDTNVFEKYQGQFMVEMHTIVIPEGAVEKSGTPW